MRLPDGKAAILYSVYEAVSNSVHAIEDRFGAEAASTTGRISIDVITEGDGLIADTPSRRGSRVMEVPLGTSETWELVLAALTAGR